MVRVVGENVKVDIYPLNVALSLAEEQSLDLVVISPKADPPVCKITDYSSSSMSKKKQKEIKSRPRNGNKGN